ncbi:protein AATF-like [Penaeus japonicus]|uniref:protein AATF-like n=1 Tax=Penaeus japonicus TaxID=27405 RepID=UPI001C70C7E0|nr:protein AATF-like [Penaeus japonicus]
MANSLQSYVEKYLLNPAASFNVDEEDQVITKPQVVDSVAKEESAGQIGQSISKLRARSAALLSESDPRYKGKKVSRKDLKKDNDVTYDPSLSKFFVLEGDEDEEEEGNDENEDDEEEDGEEEEEEVEEEESVDEDESEEESVGKVNSGLKKMALKKAGKKNKSMDEDSDESLYNEEEEDESIRKIRQRLQNDSGEFTFDNDGDFSKFGDDFEDDDEDEDEDEDDEDEELSGEEEGGVDSESGYGGSLKKFSSADQSEEVRKGRAVKSQLEIYDSLFEGRISMQKMVSQTNQLPQWDTFKLFARENDPNFTKNLSMAKSATKVLLSTLLDIQELILKKNPETQHIITGKPKKDMGTESDEEITSSEDEKMEDDDDQKETSRGTKRKMKMEEYEEVLSKRHAACIPFRDETINKWYEKTKLLSSRNAQSSFSGFEVSALQQMKNILGNKQQLIQRTQLTGATRGTAYHILGHKDSTNTEVGNEEYDAEIFDDNDFYTRSLEEVLKAKVALSDDMTDVSRKWIEIQNLRRKAKKKVDTKASKGRKIRFDVMSKLQQYLAPCYFPRMDDGAINILFASLFGNAVKNVKDTKTEPVAGEQK